MGKVMDVGFVGLGTMGAPMAANLQRAGHRLIVTDINRNAAAPFIAEGAVWADSPGRVAEQVEVVFASLPGPPEVKAVALGADGILSGMKPGSIHVDLSTNAPAQVRALHEAYTARGAHFLDAPVSGGPQGAKNGTLAVWVGGDKDAYTRAEPLIRCIGDEIRFLEGVGAGSVAKLVHNSALYAMFAVMGEAFSLGVKAGVDPLDLFDAVRVGALGRKPVFQYLLDQYLPGKFDPPAFALRLAHKDVALASALGREVGVPLRLINMTLEEMTEAMARGWDGRDSRSAMLLQQERANISIKVDSEKLHRFRDDPKTSRSPVEARENTKATVDR